MQKGYCFKLLWNPYYIINFPLVSQIHLFNPHNNHNPQINVCLFRCSFRNLKSAGLRTFQSCITNKLINLNKTLFIKKGCIVKSLTFSIPIVVFNIQVQFFLVCLVIQNIQLLKYLQHAQTMHNLTVLMIYKLFRINMFVQVSLFFQLQQRTSMIKL